MARESEKKAWIVLTKYELRSMYQLSVLLLLLLLLLLLFVELFFDDDDDDFLVDDGRCFIFCLGKWGAMYR